MVDRLRSTAGPMGGDAVRRLLKVNDSAWLFAETSRTPMQVGMLATFRVPDGQPGFVADLVSRWRAVREFSAPYNLQLRRVPVPSWVELADDAIDLDYHLRHSALPRPGSQRELGVLVSRLHSAKMDRRYPLWECHVIEGLTDRERGDDGADGSERWSLYIKAHHSQVDGVGGIRLLRRMLSVDPGTRDMLPPWAVGTHGPDQSGLPPRLSPVPEPAPEPAPEPGTAVEPAGAGGLTRLLTAGAANLGDGLRAGTSVATSLGRTYAETLLGAGGSTGADRTAPYRAPRSIFNGRIHRPRRFATQHYEVDRLRAVAQAADVSLNDVFLTVCGGALRRYLDETGHLPEESLTANVPVSVRAGEGAGVGTAITFLFALLGTDVEDPKARLEAVAASTAHGKERLPEVGAVAMDAYTAVLMAPFLSQAILGVGGRGRPSANVVVSNVPGPKETRYLDGSALEEIYPVSLLFNGQALNITAVSYAGEFNIGYTGCRDSIPSLQRIAVYSGEELQRLEAALGTAGA